MDDHDRDIGHTIDLCIGLTRQFEDVLRHMRHVLAAVAAGAELTPTNAELAVSRIDEALRAVIASREHLQALRVEKPESADPPPT